MSQSEWRKPFLSWSKSETFETVSSESESIWDETFSRWSNQSETVIFDQSDKRIFYRTNFEQALVKVFIKIGLGRMPVRCDPLYFSNGPIRFLHLHPFFFNIQRFLEKIHFFKCFSRVKYSHGLNARTWLVRGWEWVKTRGRLLMKKNQPERESKPEFC